MTGGTVFAQHARGFRLVRGDREIQRRPRMRAILLLVLFRPLRNRVSLSATPIAGKLRRLCHPSENTPLLAMNPV